RIEDEEYEPGHRPGLVCRACIVACGHEAPEAGRLALPQVDPIRRSAQSEWSACGRGPACAAIETFLDPHKVLAKAGIGGLVDADAPDRLRLRKGIADPGAALDRRRPLRRNPKGVQ